MAYWWVNQNQTYKQEINGGYLWSPKTKKDKSKNIFYDNMTRVIPGDIVFSFCNTRIYAIGLVTKIAISMPKPSEFGNIGESWDQDGWCVEIDYYELNNRIRPKDNMHTLVEFLSAKYSPIQANGNGNQAVYLAEVPPLLANALIELIGEEAKNIVNNQVVNLLHDSHEDKVEGEIKQNILVGPTEQEQLVKSRRGQGIFRINVERIEKFCRVTKTTIKNLLIASHIKPWRDSNDFEKLDGNNGLLLAPHIDKLFDAGYISFQQDGKILISDQLDRSIFRQWGIDEALNVGEFSDKQEVYLNYHRERLK